MRYLQKGFTLIEIAIVLLIVAILLGYSVAMLPKQQELKQYRHAESEMNSILEHLIAFAQVNGRLPCPDTSTDTEAPANSVDGEEDQLNDPNDGCEAYFGFLPARTLGINGKYNDDGVLIDPWGWGYGYAVSNVNAGGGGDTNPDLVTGNGIRNEGMATVLPDLQICDDSQTAGTHVNCAATTGGNLVIDNVAAVVISQGKDNSLAAPMSPIQEENTDDFDDGTNDKVYIFSPRRDDYDDLVKWIPRNLLFSRMLDAGQLP